MKYEDKPKEVGHYWIKNWLSSKPARIIKVWTYSFDTDGKLFTSDDGGASVDDEYYDNYRWYGPLEEPPAL